jgi:hypothetical protein
MLYPLQFNASYMLHVSSKVVLDAKNVTFHVLSPRANYTTERPTLVGEVIANFCG